MNEKKSTFLRVQIDTKTEKVIRKILEVKGLSIQGLLENLIKDYIFQNLDCLVNNNDRK